MTRMVTISASQFLPRSVPAPTTTVLRLAPHQEEVKEEEKTEERGKRQRKKGKKAAKEVLKEDVMSAVGTITPANAPFGPGDWLKKKPKERANPGKTSLRSNGEPGTLVSLPDNGTIGDQDTNEERVDLRLREKVWDRWQAKAAKNGQTPPI